MVTQKGKHTYTRSRGLQRIILMAVAALLIVLLAACGGNDKAASDEATKTNSNAAQGSNVDTNNGKSEEKVAEETAANQTEEATEPLTGGEVNIYTARHYDVDAELYAKFTEQTGIKVNVIEGKAPELIEKIAREGASTPADLFITVDGGILNTAKTEGLLQPIAFDLLDEQVPAKLRDVDNEWIGLSSRARVIVYAKDRVDAPELSTYEDLADEKWKGRLAVRSSTNLYNLSLLASLIEINGEEAAEQWAAGIAANLARDPEGGDRDQAKVVASGVADVAIMNTYYLGRMLNSEDQEEVKVAQSLDVFFPNQETTGTHLNVSGAGLIKHSKNPERALKLLEFLTGPEAQTIISQANFEYPVNPAAEWPEELKQWGEFKTQDIDFAAYGIHNPKAVELVNKVGWK